MPQLNRLTFVILNTKVILITYDLIIGNFNSQVEQMRNESVER